VFVFVFLFVFAGELRKVADSDLEVAGSSSSRTEFESGRGHVGFVVDKETMEQVSSVTSVLTRARRRKIPEDGILHSHRRENLKSYIALTCWDL
jgi:hypothetical protein